MSAGWSPGSGSTSHSAIRIICTDMGGVIGTNIHSGPSEFVRVTVLPLELEGGKSSFIPADAAEAAKPRSVKQKLFGERGI
jgi:hypothetical protein